MLDGVDAGADGGLDAGRAVGVGGDLHARHVRLVGDGLHLLVGQLLWPGLVAAREDAAGRADLDHLRAVLALAAHLLRPLLGAVDDAGLFSSIEGGKKVSSQWPPVRRAHSRPP